MPARFTLLLGPPGFLQEWVQTLGLREGPAKQLLSLAPPENLVHIPKLRIPQCFIDAKRFAHCRAWPSFMV